MKHSERLILLLIILSILITVGRYRLFYTGDYDAPSIPEIDADEIAPHLPAYQPFEDQPTLGNGYVIIDLAHANNLKIDDLSPLRDRIEARGAIVETLSPDDENNALEARLQRATGLIVAAPTQAYTSEEQEVIAEFVNDGGHLLLAADPTRPVPEEADEEDLFLPLYSFFFPTSAVPIVNSLANVFGIVYFDDYLYNLHDNAGNYRHVMFRDLSDEHPLTQDVGTIVFFAAHSLRSEGLALIKGGEHTHSAIRSGETNLAAASLTTEGRVLALGDITFMTPPYHTLEDNDRFLSRIADWLTVDERIRDRLDDFPYIFTQPVGLTPIGDEFVDPRIIVYGSELQTTFETLGLTLELQAVPQPNHDLLLIGTFDNAGYVREYLTTAGITVTVPFTDSIPETDIQISPGDEGETPAIENGPDGYGTLKIEDLGTIGIKGTQLFVLRTQSQRAAPTSVIVLAEDEAQLINALDRLTISDFSGCIHYAEAGKFTITLCSTGDVEEETESDDYEESPTEEEEEHRIFILAYDGGPEGERTGASEMEAILSDSEDTSSAYDVTVWSVNDDGVPTSEDMEGYAAYIIDTGDYALDPEDVDFLNILDNIEVFKVMFIGAQSMPLFDAEYAPIYDLEVADSDHPLATAFDAGDVISLLDSESEVPALVVSDVEDDDLADTASVVFSRGPDSPEAGSPALMAIVEEGAAGEDDSRAVIATFAFYRLPEETQRTLALNVVAWLLDEE